LASLREKRWLPKAEEKEWRKSGEGEVDSGGEAAGKRIERS